MPVVRAMPNTPALVGQGAAAISPGRHAGEDDLSWAADILSSVGIVVRVPESQLDAVTGLSGSGPAYVFLLAEAMTDGGVLVGLPRETVLVVQTLLGAATLLAAGDRSAEDLRAAAARAAPRRRAADLERGPALVAWKRFAGHGAWS
jgi:pyrroline-5-carboxylate reductase